MLPRIIVQDLYSEHSKLAELFWRVRNESLDLAEVHGVYRYGSDTNLISAVFLRMPEGLDKPRDTEHPKSASLVLALKLLSNVTDTRSQ